MGGVIIQGGKAVGDGNPLHVLESNNVADPVIVKMNQITNGTISTSETLVNQYDIELETMTGVLVGTYLIIFSPATNRFYKGYVLDINSNTVTMDSPLDSTFPAGSFVDITKTNMNANGSAVAPVTFGLRGVSDSPTGLVVDVTRIIIYCQTATAVDLTKFGDIVAGITNGLVLRVRNGRNFNIFNIKTNGEIASEFYDWSPHAKSNPVQGADGFVARLTFAGESKIGTAIRLKPGEDLEAVIRDNLSTITLLNIVAEGHIASNIV